MKIRRLIIDNFLSVGHADIQIDGNGVVLIEGKTLDKPSGDSNAAGKSAMFADSLLWVLYDSLLRDLTKDGVVNDKIGKNCSVRIEFEHTGKVHEITRYRNHDTYSNDLRYTVDGVDITGTTPSVTQEAIEKHLNIPKEVFLHTVVLGQGFQYRLSALTDGDKKQLLENLLVCGHPSSGATVFDAARENAHRAKNSADTKLVIAKTRLDMLRREEGSILNALASHETAKVTWESHHTEAIKHNTDALASMDVELNKVLVRLNEIVDKCNARDKLITELQVLHEKDAAALSEARVRLDVASIGLRSSQRSLDSLPKGACPTCLRPFDGPDRETVVGTLQKAVRSANMSHLGNTTDYDVRKQASDLSARRTDELEESTKHLDTERAALNGSITGSAANKKHRLSELERLKKELNPHDGQAVVLESRLTEVESDMKSAEASIAKYAKLVELSKFWMSAFQALRGRALTQILRYLNDRLSYYLSVLSEEDMTMEMSLQQRGRTKEEIAISVNDKPYGGASAGERRRVDVSLAFAMHDLATILTGFRCNVMVVDEIGDALDGAGVERLVQILEEKAHDISTIFVISHDLKLRAKITKKWVVERSDRVSSLITSG